MKNRLLLASSILFLLAACSDTINGKGIAEPAVAQFHEKLNLGDFESIYEDASAEFKAAVPREKILQLFGAITRKLGPLQEPKLINWNVNTRNLKTVVVLVQDSKFEEGQATETFTFRVDDEKAELIGYNISSLDMLIK
jgi:hypothetical protein